MNKSGIYKIKYNQQCLYIGQSINIKDRIAGHQRKLRKGSHDNIYLQRLYNKYGLDFEYSIVEIVEDKTLLTEREMYWISQMTPICNMQIPSDSTFFTITEESRQKMSYATKSRMDDAMRQKISIRTKEAMQRPEVRQRFLQGQYNKPYKEPWIKGKHIKTNPGKKVMCVEKNQVFNSAVEAGHSVGAKNGKGVSRVCTGERERFRKLHWIYI